MKTFYSILYCPIRLNADEKISLALLLVQDEKVYFEYSTVKLKAINQLLPKEAHQLLKNNLKSIDSFIKQKNGNVILSSFKEQIFDQKYISYLSNYANNLLAFSPPKAIDIDASIENFEKLFSKYVFESSAEYLIETSVNFIDQIKDAVNPKIESSVNIDIELRSDNLPGLPIPTKVWFIGKNEKTVTGELFDFDSKISKLENSLRSYLFLIQHVIQYDSFMKKEGVFFLVGDEPLKANSENHRIWDLIRQLKNISYTPTNEAPNMIELYIQQHGVSPFVDKV